MSFVGQRILCIKVAFKVLKLGLFFKVKPCWGLGGWVIGWVGGGLCGWVGGWVDEFMGG